MPYFITLVFILLLTVLANGEESANDLFHNDARITGGTIAQWGEFPAAVQVVSPFIQNNCIGTIIDRHHVLTAAHCVTTFSGQLENSFWITVIAGDINISPHSYQREVRNVTAIFVHPGYAWNTRNHNLAVLRVNRPFPEFHNTIEPAVRRTRFLVPNEQCRFAAWGTATSEANAPVRLEQRFITLPIMTNAACNAATVHNNQVLTTMLCAGTLVASTNSICNGNDGGGLYCLVDGEWELTGTLTFGVACGGVNAPAVFMEIRQYDQWLQQQMLRSDIPAPGSMPVPV